MSGGADPGARAIVLTCDNLGEASALQRGTWDPRTPLGSDPSVTQALPWLLDALDHSGLRATFFVEAINCELNPEALRAIDARGHELGVHGWEHEVWGELDLETERELLQRATRAFAALGLGARGFRPPGGKLTAQTPALLRELGFDWCSPATGGPGGDSAGGPGGGSPGGPGGGSPAGADPAGDEIAIIPFDWELVDAYHLMDRFGDLRASRGDDRAALSADAAGERMAAGLREAAAPRTVILHPFLMLDPAWRGQVQRLLELMAAQGAVMPGGMYARSRVGP